jgi:hypothetical protein
MRLERGIEWIDPMRVVDPDAANEERRCREELQSKPRDPEVLKRWDRALNRIWTPFLREAYCALLKGDFTHVEVIVTFLEEDPIFFRSGYAKETVLQRLKPEHLSKKQIEQLRLVCLRAVDNCPRREYRRYCRLAARIADRHMAEVLESKICGSGVASSRARLMLASVARHGPRGLTGYSEPTLKLTDWFALAAASPQLAEKSIGRLNIQHVRNAIRGLRESDRNMNSEPPPPDL